MHSDKPDKGKYSTPEEVNTLNEVLKDSGLELTYLEWAMDKAAIIAMTDLEGRIIYANEKFCQVSQYTTDELLGQNHRILKSGFHPDTFFKTMYRTISKGKTWKGQIKNRAKDGTCHWLDTTILPLKDTSDRVIMYLTIRFDITEQKKLEERLERDKKRFQAIFDISDAFGSIATSDFSGALQKTAEILCLVLGGSVIIRIVLQHEEKNLRFMAYYDKDEEVRETIREVFESIPFPYDKGTFDKVIKGNRHIFIPDLKKTDIIKDKDYKLSLLMKGYEEVMAIVFPLRVMNRAIGIVSLTHMCPVKSSYIEEDSLFLTNIARKISLGISNAELYRQNQLEIERRKKTEESLVEYELRYRQLFYNKTMGIAHCRIILDDSGKPQDFEILEINEAYTKITGLAPSDIQGKTAREIFPGLDELPFDYIGSYGKVALFGGDMYFEEYFLPTQQWLSIYVYRPVYGEFTAIFTDVTERKHMEERLIESQKKLLEAQRLGHMGSYVLDITTGKMQWTEEMFRIFGLDEKGPVPGLEEISLLVHPDDRAKIEIMIRKIIETKEPDEDTYRITTENGTLKYVHSVGHPEVGPEGNVKLITGTLMDVTDSTLTQLRTEQLVKDLERSNKELEQFAYIASHDLQEPLRMVSNFLSIISRKYTDKLDSQGREYIRFAVDGAYRMNGLIKDLLTFSRISSKNKEPERVDLNEVLKEILSDISVVIKENSAQVTYGSLPVVMADKIQMWQLFKNLIINALKFRQTKPPKVHISAEKKGYMWQFTVRDNGIGIDKDYFDRIFMIFQRLHEREKYPGTGIGLSVCQKIVERHGGRIWVESEVGKGSAFFFLLPS